MNNINYMQTAKYWSECGHCHPEKYAIGTGVCNCICHQSIEVQNEYKKNPFGKEDSVPVEFIGKGLASKTGVPVEEIHERVLEAINEHKEHCFRRNCHRCLALDKNEEKQYVSGDSFQRELDRDREGIKQVFIKKAKELLPEWIEISHPKVEHSVQCEEQAWDKCITSCPRKDYDGSRGRATVEIVNFLLFLEKNI